MLGKTGGGVNPFLSLPDPNSSTDYKKGYVMRKCCIDPNGKRTKLGKRSWKMFFLSLRDMVLYCFKEEKSLRLDGAFCDVNNAIRVHHGLAERASDYTKKQFVFRLHTADQVSRYSKITVNFGRIVQIIIIFYITVNNRIKISLNELLMSIFLGTVPISNLR